MPLPLAILGLTLEDFGDEGAEVAAECADLLQRVQWPIFRGDSDAYNALWEMLDAPESLYNSLHDRIQLERKLDLLSHTTKEQA
jgi:hypothetical protein